MLFQVKAYSVCIKNLKTLSLQTSFYATKLRDLFRRKMLPLWKIQAQT